MAESSRGAVRELHTRSLEIATDFVDAVTPDDLGRPTPCGAWDLDALLAHMVGQNRGFAGAVAEDVGIDAFAPVTGVHASTWRESATTLHGAFTAAPDDRTVVLPEIDVARRLPLDVVVAVHLLDTVVHTWDVATSLGLAWRPTPATARVVLGVARSVPDGEARRAPGAPFAPVREAPDDDPWHRALGLLGRATR